MTDTADVFRCRFCKGEGGYAWLCTHRCEAEAIAQEWSSGDTLFTPEHEPEPERRERPCIGPPECSCPSCLRAMIARHAPHLTPDTESR